MADFSLTTDNPEVARMFIAWEIAKDATNGMNLGGLDDRQRKLVEVVNNIYLALSVPK